MGRRAHPERPYDDPRVHAVVDDARHAFRLAETDSYDLVVFGLLDSHTQLGTSSVRLDNYVYTLQSIDRNERFRLEAAVSELETRIDTISDLYGNANWLEREAFDRTLDELFDDRLPTLRERARCPDPDAALTYKHEGKRATPAPVLNQTKPSSSSTMPAIRSLGSPSALP